MINEGAIVNMRRVMLFLVLMVAFVPFCGSIAGNCNGETVPPYSWLQSGLYLNTARSKTLFLVSCSFFLHNSFFKSN
jgi:hypothetical protein